MPSFNFHAFKWTRLEMYIIKDFHQYWICNKETPDMAASIFEPSHLFGDFFHVSFFLLIWLPLSLIATSGKNRKTAKKWKIMQNVHAIHIKYVLHAHVIMKRNEDKLTEIFVIFVFLIRYLGWQILWFINFLDMTTN